MKMAMLEMVVLSIGFLMIIARAVIVWTQHRTSQAKAWVRSTAAYVAVEERALLCEEAARHYLAQRKEDKERNKQN